MNKFTKGLDPKDAMNIGNVEERKRNKEHLTFIYYRLIQVLGENPNVDYMIKFEEIINKM
ncbi:MAG: hypothetical protein WC554_09760 [Clostridia bacterium]